MVQVLPPSLLHWESRIGSIWHVLYAVKLEKVREEEYIIAAETMGIPKWRILWRHILPNCVGPIIITLTLAIPDAIFTEAFLSFIGLGVNAPMASWGVLASDGISSEIVSIPIDIPCISN